MRPFLPLVLAAITAAPALAADGLPLPHGYYVATDIPCGQASNFSTYLLTRDSLRMGPEICRFSSFDQEEDRVYIITEQCDSKAEASYGWVVAPDGKGFHRTGPAMGETRARFCPQNSMPEPWRSNDIRALSNSGITPSWKQTIPRLGLSLRHACRFACSSGILQGWLILCSTTSCRSDGGRLSKAASISDAPVGISSQSRAEP